MSAVFRVAGRRDVGAAVELLRDDGLGQTRETAAPEAYLAAFAEMMAVPGNRLIVGERDGEIVATYQMTIIPGISLAGARRAQIEGVRVASGVRGQGVGALLISDAEARSRAAGAVLLQLTMNQSREDSRRFYEREGFVASHFGFKKSL
ncbi:GNAT family N-acetyltransferase [uncultured Boseongicola sp.]|uniref:GNAT family N-acetyltransferase n=1 Tax=uncultured Boseongicola sp. TaxID=1648499 RepID=UPI0026308A99|nr:GNAT family N-acetyltransferase [uncultured Boseongicola sp.]